MTHEPKHFAEFESFKKTVNPQERSKIMESIEDPYSLTGMDRLRAFYGMMGLEFDEEGFQKIIERYSMYK